MQTIRITTSQNIDIDYEIGGLGERIVARIIDYALFMLIMILGLIVANMTHTSLNEWSPAAVIMLIIYASLYVFYDLVCEIFMNGQSVGKKVMKIKVISLDGGRPSVSQYLLRWLFRIVDFTISFNFCALICAAVSENNQRLGDIVAGTVLIKTSPRTQIGSIVFMPAPAGYEAVFKEAGQLNDRDIELIHDVINNYVKTGNNVLVYEMADKVKRHLGIAVPAGMNNMIFLQTIIRDYNFISAQMDVL
ncbi:MAG TPA: RDD family protein [Mucilaginibacter sp.]|nr:RDD family protein [Mucilaginibacter sp.]